MDHRTLERDEEFWRRLRRHGSDHAARHQEAEGVDGIRGIGHEHDVAGRRDGLRHIGKPLLRTQGRDDLPFRIELHAEAAGVVVGLRAAEPRDALRGRIAVGAGLAGRFDQLVDDVLGGRQVGVAHAEIDDVRAGCPGRRLEPVDLLEDVGRQAFDAMEFGHRGAFRRSACGRFV